MIKKLLRNRRLICDSEIEKNRYDNRAKDELLKIKNKDFNHINYSEFMRPIFERYDKLIFTLIKPGMKVLEIGAGTGSHTEIIVKTGADIVAQDISEVSLEVLRAKLGSGIKTIASNMESIPIDDHTFDFIVCCNVLSYGNPLAVNKEIFRLIKPGGNLLIMDSINHNFFYRFNRRIHYYRGNRTKSTLKRVPSFRRIKQFSERFESSMCFYFGSYFWVVIPVKYLLGQRAANSFNRILEKIKPSGLGAFKFILVCEKYIS
jgi:ubiquinone/menaquinone biosynthesis C-methylase UbiE